jgi:single-strand DNA-binding protein
MTNGINKAIVVGRVLNRPVLSRKTHGVYIKLIMATQDREKNRETFQLEDTTDTHTVIIQSPLAERLDGKILQGHLLYIEGKMKTLKVKHLITGLMQNFPEVRAYTIEFLTRPHSSPQGSGHHSTPQRSTTGQAPKDGRASPTLFRNHG